MIEVTSHVEPSHFTEDGIFQLKDAALPPTYSSDNGCVITKIQGMESCGLENCKENCFKESSGLCYEVSNHSKFFYSFHYKLMFLFENEFLNFAFKYIKAYCDNQNKSLPTIFLNCKKYGPHTCTNAEYVTYEKSYENTDKFTIVDGTYMRLRMH